MEDGVEMWETPEGLHVYQNCTVELDQLCQAKSPLAAQTSNLRYVGGRGRSSRLAWAAVTDECGRSVGIAY